MVRRLFMVFVWNLENLVFVLTLVFISENSKKMKINLTFSELKDTQALKNRLLSDETSLRENLEF